MTCLIGVRGGREAATPISVVKTRAALAADLVRLP
jgi:hypothetical protein